ncbi:Prophage CP4-57 regulatory protein (AlpA) [compost metagenome]
MSSAQPVQSGERLLRLRDVKDRTGLGSSTIYRYIQAGTFPAPVKIGGFTARWRETQVAAWIDALPRLGARTTSSSGI